MTMTIGDPLPALTRQTTNGEIALRDYATQPLVIYFYPKDNTPGCTTESTDFRDQYRQFTEKSARILGVSRDSIQSHNAFASKYDLPFALISDSDEVMCNAFGVIKLKKNYGREYLGIERSTFLFNSKGILAREWRSVKVAGHVALVRKAVHELAE